tara:strand:- start:5372 stop:5659 length:288 start_codon:yes stop_codon:yes gene_type:complete
LDKRMDNDWTYDDCRLENNNLIRKGCGYNQNFRFKAELSKDINIKTIMWCDKNCDGKYGWHFQIKQPSAKWPTREQAVMTFQKKIDCINFKLKQL